MVALIRDKGSLRMNAPSVLVFEKDPRWEPELKRQLITSGIAVRATRSLQGLRDLCDVSPGSVVLLDLRAGVGECLRFAIQATQRSWQTQILVIGTVETRDLEWVARELGADHFELDTIRGEKLARICRQGVKQRTIVVGEELRGRLPA